MLSKYQFDGMAILFGHGIMTVPPGVLHFKTSGTSNSTKWGSCHMEYQKIALVYNSYSGLLKPTWKVDQLIEYLKVHADVTLIDVAEDIDIESEVLNACQKHTDLVIACGGDGTVHHCANGIINAQTETLLAVLPFGTVNDFASVVGMTDKIDHFIEIIEAGQTKKIDVGVCNGRYFINVVAAGAFTEIGYAVPRPLKKIFGRLAYLAYGVKDSLKYLKESHRVTLTINGRENVEDINLFTVTNSNSVGGFRNYVRSMELDDGNLYLMVMRKGTFMQAVKVVMNYISTQKFSGETIDYYPIKTFKANSIDKIRCDIDGEKGGRLPLKITIMEKKLNILIPPA
jgi:diacylglycerol kinase (ATP)